MRGGKMERKKRNIYWMVSVTGILLAGLFGCTMTEVEKEKYEISLFPTPTPYILDRGKAMEKTISAEKGGQIVLTTSEGQKISLIFPQQALEKDLTLVATSLTECPLSDQKDILAKGILLEEKGREGEKNSVQFQFPIILSITVKGSVPQDVSIIKYVPEKDTYEVIPTDIAPSGGETTLTAELISLSAYGVRKVSWEEIQKAARKKKDQGLWHINVKDTAQKTFHYSTVTCTLSLMTSNMSGKVTGPYTGVAFLTAESRPTIPMPPHIKVGTKHQLQGSATIKIIVVGGQDTSRYLGEGALNLDVQEVGKVETPDFGITLPASGSLSLWLDVTINGPQANIVIVRGPNALYGLRFKGTLWRGK